MTNFEKYQKEILNIVSKQSLAVKEGKPAPCDDTNCNECILNVKQCGREIIKWLYAEAKPILTAKERAFCEIVGEGYISRDKDGELFYSQSDKPYKDDEIWVVDCNDYITLPGDLFKFITWEDKEPWAVEELLKLEVEE
jgi:hypothetical protein